MKKILTSRQMCLMFIISIVSLKFLFFPAIVSKYAFNDTYLSVFAGLGIDFLIVLIVVYAMKQFPDKSFKDIICENLHKGVYYVMYVLLFVYCMLKALLAVKEVHHYFLEYLYEDFSWLWFATPMLILVAYVASKGLRSVGRTVEILFILIALGIVVTLIVPVKDFNIENLAPFMAHKKGIVEGIFHSTFAYADWIILVLIMGRVKIHKNTHKKILIITAGAYLFVFAFFVLYVGLFKNIGIYKPYAFSDIPQYTDLPNNSARIDWFSSIIWTFAQMLQVCIMVGLSAQILRDMFEKIPPVACGMVCGSIILAGMLVFYMNLSKLIDVITSSSFVIVILCFHAIIPLILLLCVIINKMKARRKGGEYYGIRKKVS